MTEIVDRLLYDFSLWFQAHGWPVEVFDLTALLALFPVCIACGLVGPFIIGNRMAFFSDAMAHTAFAGAALGMLALILAVNPANPNDAGAHAWIIIAVMVGFGISVGIGIAFIRERTGLSADSVIGVFFAFAVGFAAMLIPPLNQRVRFEAEQFLFGAAQYASSANILALIAVAVVAALFIAAKYNALALAGFNPSLARTRNVHVRLNNYLFVVLLSLIVNLSIPAVGVMLINALLIVPAAAAANLARNVRQLSAYALVFSLLCTIGGYLLSRTARLPLPDGDRLELRPGGTIVVLCVLLFFLSALVSVFRGRRVHGADSAC